MQFVIKKFTELNTEELYNILALRSEIFVVEQQCIYQDLDQKDKEGHHIIGIEEEEIAGYARVLSPGTIYPAHTAIGRVLVSERHRKKNYGYLVMEQAIELCQKQYPTFPIKISAQSHLDRFYSNLKFRATGKRYLEDGIPHQEMIYSPSL